MNFAGSAASEGRYVARLETYRLLGDFVKNVLSYFIKVSCDFLQIARFEIEKCIFNI